MAYAVLAVVAWVGVALGVFVTFSGLYPATDIGPTEFTGTESGFISGVVDYFSYFTHISNIIVAVVATMLARDPQRRGRFFDVVFLDSLVMITVTGIIYNILLAPGAPPRQGLEQASNVVQHMLTPALAVLVFLLWGPYRRWNWRTPFAALVIPLIYAAWTILHGAVVGAYPYGILDVITYGYASVLTTLAMIVVLGVVLGFVFLGLGRLLARTTSKESISA